MKTVAMLSRKGGTGKTTLSLHLAVAAQAAGHATVLADLDRQQSSVEWRRRRKAADPRVLACKPGALFTLQQDHLRAGADLLVVDTGPSGGDDAEQAVRCADLCLIVLRPNFLDITAIADSVGLARRMGRPAAFIINQAPPRCSGVEAGSITKTIEALRIYGLPLAPIGLRSRPAYQQALESGLTAPELEPKGAAASELGALWRHVEGLLWPQTGLLRNSA